MPDDLSPLNHYLAEYVRVAKRALDRLAPYLITTDARPPGVDEDFKELILIADKVHSMGEASEWLLMGTGFEAWFHEKGTSMHKYLAIAVEAWQKDISLVKLVEGAPMTDREWLRSEILNHLRASLHYAATLFKEAIRDVPAWE